MVKSIFSFIFLFIFLFINVAIVAYSAIALKRIMKKELSFVKRALLAHGLWVILFTTINFIELAHLGILVPFPPYDDVYIPYYFVPGIEIYYIIMRYFGDYVFESLNPLTSHYTASIITIVYFPGLLGLFLGSIKWYLYCLIWEKFKKWRKTK